MRNFYAWFTIEFWHLRWNLCNFWRYRKVWQRLQQQLRKGFTLILRGRSAKSQLWSLTSHNWWTQPRSQVGLGNIAKTADFVTKLLPLWHWQQRPRVWKNNKLRKQSVFVFFSEQMLSPKWNGRFTLGDAQLTRGMRLGCFLRRPLCCWTLYMSFSFPGQYCSWFKSPFALPNAVI